MSRSKYLSAVVASLATSIAALFYSANLAAQTPAGAEKFVPKGWSVERTVQGELTGDKLDDVVIVAIANQAKGADGDTARMLIVLMRKSDGSFEQIGTSAKLLLCKECFGMMGDGPEISIKNRVLVVDQLTGSRDTDQGIWRFRFDPKERKMRLIGLDIKRTDRAVGSGTVESTNYLTGKRITGSYAYDQRSGKSVLKKSHKTSVSVPTTFLEQATSDPLTGE